MNCPKCGFAYSVVKDSRNTDIGKRRRRECSGCGFRYTAIEILETEYKKYRQVLRSAETLKKQAEEFCNEYKNIKNQG
jgi:transcriptional regulator NrdR family protein